MAFSNILCRSDENILSKDQISYDQCEKGNPSIHLLCSQTQNKQNSSDSDLPQVLFIF